MVLYDASVGQQLLMVVVAVVLVVLSSLLFLMSLFSLSLLSQSSFHLQGGYSKIIIVIYIAPLPVLKGASQVCWKRKRTLYMQEIERTLHIVNAVNIDYTRVGDYGSVYASWKRKVFTLVLKESRLDDWRVLCRNLLTRDGVVKLEDLSPQVLR